MQSHTSPLRRALAGLCGPTARAGRHSLTEQLAAAGLELRVYTPPRHLDDPQLEQVCRQAARLGLVLTDVDGKVVGGLQAVSAEALEAEDSASTAMPVR